MLQFFGDAMDEMHAQRSNDGQAHTGARGAEAPPPICVALEICDDAPAPEKRIPTIVVRERKEPAHQVMIVDDAMIIGEPTEPRIELDVEPEVALIDRTVPWIATARKDGPDVKKMITAFVVCFVFSTLGSMIFARYTNDAPTLGPMPMPMPLPLPVVPARAAFVVDEPPKPVVLTARSRAAQPRSNPVRRRMERKWDPLRAKIIFRASDI